MNGSPQLSNCYLRSLPQPNNNSPTDLAISNIVFNSDTYEYELDTNLADGHHDKLANNQGWNALCKASYVGNVDLVHHLIKKNKDVAFVNLGTFFGWAPILCASLCEHPDEAIAISQLLINAGADINAATPSDRTIHGERVTPINWKTQIVPRFATALWCSINITHNIGLTHLLERKGGVFAPICLFDESSPG